MSDTKLYTCEDCGKPTTRYHAYDAHTAKLLGIAGHARCQECADKHLDFIMWENEQYDTDELVCPWCGYKDPDSWELADEDDEYECPNCGRVFEYVSEMSRTFTSRKRKQDYPGDDAQ